MQLGREGRPAGVVEAGVCGQCRRGRPTPPRARARAAGRCRAPCARPGQRRLAVEPQPLVDVPAGQGQLGAAAEHHHGAAEDRLAAVHGLHLGEQRRRLVVATHPDVADREQRPQLHGVLQRAERLHRAERLVDVGPRSREVAHLGGETCQLGGQQRPLPGALRVVGEGVRRPGGRERAVEVAGVLADLAAPRQRHHRDRRVLVPAERVQHVGLLDGVGRGQGEQHPHPGGDPAGTPGPHRAQAVQGRRHGLAVEDQVVGRQGGQHPAQLLGALGRVLGGQQHPLGVGGEADHREVVAADRPVARQHGDEAQHRRHVVVARGRGAARRRGCPPPPAPRRPSSTWSRREHRRHRPVREVDGPARRSRASASSSSPASTSCMPAELADRLQQPVAHAGRPRRRRPGTGRPAARPAARGPRRRPPPPRPRGRSRRGTPRAAAARPAPRRRAGSSTSR